MVHDFNRSLTPVLFIGRDTAPCHLTGVVFAGLCHNRLENDVKSMKEKISSLHSLLDDDVREVFDKLTSKMKEQRKAKQRAANR